MLNRLLLGLLVFGILVLAIGGFTVRGLRRALRAVLRPGVAGPRPGRPAPA